jgi:hypothetical protein
MWFFSRGETMSLLAVWEVRILELAIFVVFVGGVVRWVLHELRR